MNRHVVLLVSSNQELTELCRLNLIKGENIFHSVPDCDSALDLFDENFTGVVIIDASVVDTTYPGFLKYISEVLKVPVIIIGHENTPDEKIRYLDAGAVSYIVQPFNPDEFVAQVKALLRKTGTKESNPGITEFGAGDLYINYKRRLVTVNGAVVELSPLEYALLYELTLHAGRVISHTHLLQTLWGYEYIEAKQHLHLNICYLRKKIEPNPRKPEYIMTVPKVGYVFRHEEKE